MLFRYYNRAANYSAVYIFRQSNNYSVVYWPPHESRQSLNIALDFYVWRRVRLAQSAVW